MCHEGRVGYYTMQQRLAHLEGLTLLLVITYSAASTALASLAALEYVPSTVLSPIQVVYTTCSLKIHNL